MKNLQTKVKMPPFFNFVDPDNHDFLKEVSEQSVDLFKLRPLAASPETVCNSSNLDQFLDIINHDVRYAEWN